MSNKNENWNLCLASKEGRDIIEISSTALIHDLYQVAESRLGASISAMKYGFPPKLVDRECSQPVHEILQNHERIQVELGNQEDQPPKKVASSSSAHQASVATSPSATRKSKRAASHRATETMPAMIQAQEQILEEQKPTGPSKRPRKIASVSSSSSTTKPQQRPPVPKTGPGRRLADGATVGVAPRKRKGLLSNSSGTTDPSEALLGAIQDSGKMGQVLRRGMKDAVQSSYETTKAYSRLAAIQARSYTMTHKQNSYLQVAYRGTVEKALIQEDVDCIPRVVLEAVIYNIHTSNEEALRPENLALMSPRVLWSLVHIFPNHTNVSDMYKELLPNLNWSFLRRRAQRLSEKAMENLRQQQVDSGIVQDGTKAIEAIAAVEHAMEHVQEYTASERQARQAQAALNRLRQSSSSDNGPWKLVTPTEVDCDELYQCIQDTTSANANVNETTKLINKLLRECHIHNWRELANIEDASLLAKKLNVSLEQVQMWIDRAQDRSVDEIIVEICDGNVRAVELLTEKAHSSTPKDLAMWRSIPQLLHQRLMGNRGTPTVSQLLCWSERAHQVLQDYEWLNWYATPVE